MAAPIAGKKSLSLLSRFKGALVGAVAGDCLGANFEGFWHIIQAEELEKFFRSLDDKDDIEVQQYTDDTAMARSVAGSLIENKGLNITDMAKRYVTEYKNEPNRGYGANVGTVFGLLEKTDYSDIFKPASLQFDGQGSYGNGGAMRISPASLFGLELPDDKFIKFVTDCTRITHSNPDAINGALLQSLAVRQALREEPGKIDTNSFIDKLLGFMENLEGDKKEDTDSPKPKRKPKKQPFCDKLNKIKEYLKQEEEVSAHELEKTLGNDVSALGSVPAAVFSFVRCTKPVSHLKFDNPMLRTVCYAVSLGGDTDTIATMAGAIAGAYYGIDEVPSRWFEICEGTDTALAQAEELYKLHDKVNTGQDK